MKLSPSPYRFPSASRLGWLSASAALLALAGCAPVTHPPEAASVSLPEAFAGLDEQAAASAVQPGDLLPKSDPAYIALLQSAMQSAPDLDIALARIDQARAGYRAAGAERAPNVSARFGAQGQRISAAQFGGSGNTPFQIDKERGLFSTGIDASWDADIFGRLRASQRAARARLDAASADAAAVRLALITDIARLVSEYRINSARQSAVDEDISRTGSLAALMRQRARAGLVPERDWVSAQALLAQVRSRKEVLRSEAVVLEAQLATLTARPMADVQTMLSEPAGDTALDGLPELAVPSLLLRRRPDIIAAERRLAAADADLAAAAAARFPRLTINATLGLIALSLGDLFTSDALIGALGGEVAGPLLDFGRVGAEIDAREAQGAEAFAEYRKSLFRAMAEVEAALGAMQANQRQMQALETQLALERDAAHLAQIRYRHGLDNYLTVLDAERRIYTAEDALQLARGSVLAQRIALYRAMGGEGAETSEMSGKQGEGSSPGQSGPE